LGAWGEQSNQLGGILSGGLEFALAVATLRWTQRLDGLDQLGQTNDTETTRLPNGRSFAIGDLELSSRGKHEDSVGRPIPREPGGERPDARVHPFQIRLEQSDGTLDTIGLDELAPAALQSVPGRPAQWPAHAVPAFRFDDHETWRTGEDEVDLP